MMKISLNLTNIKVNLNMDNIFITGANGFLGSNLVKFFLDVGHKVIAVIRADGAQDNLTNLDCQVIEYDGSISSLEIYLNSNTTVVHTASYYVAEHKKEDVAILTSSNLQYGLNLLEAMRISGTKKIINIGTAWQGYKGEERRPVNLYAATKQAFEDIISYYCDAEDFSSISLRLNDTYGEEDKRIKLVKLLINSGIKQTTLEMSLGEQRINLTHISDVCRAVSSSVNSLKSEGNMQVYNLINKDEYSLKELVKLIERELNIIIPVNFGAREYREREVMEPLKSDGFKLCDTKVNIKDGVKRIMVRMSEGA